MASSDQQNANKPRSTPTDDMRFVVDVLGHSIFNPMEVLTAVGPTLSELTCGLLGHRFRPERDIPDLSRKTIFVTGGNTGLGKETILQLARHNPARIYLAARNEEKAKNAIQSIKADLSSSAVDVDIQFVQLDLSSFPSIRKAAETFTKNNSRLDILILNAGVMSEAPVTTPQGHEIQFGTNHIGHFLLTKLLLPTLLQTASTTSEVRVVVVASIASLHTPRHPDYMDLVSTPQTLLDLSTWQRYAVSKAANILFAAEFARRFPSITCVSAHPGVVSSDLYNSTQATNRIVGPMLPALKLLFRTVRSGTLNQLWAAAGARKTNLLSGAYYTSVGHENPHNRFVVDRELGKKLWDWTDREVERV